MNRAATVIIKKMPVTVAHPPFFTKQATVLRALFCCLFLLYSTSAARAEVISLDGSWQYSSVNPSETESTNGFNQRYGIQWNPQVTRAISFDTNFSYSKNITTGNIVRKTVSPAGNFKIENDLFFTEISGLINETSNTDRPDQLDQSWEAILASNWNYEFWPDLSVIFGQKWLKDNEEVPLTDANNQWSEFIIQWESETIETYYSLYSQIREDGVEGTSYDELKHFGRVDYGDSFFGNRLSLNASGQLTQSTTDLTVTPGSGNSALVNVQASQAFAGVDPVPTSGALPTAPGLLDGNRNSAVFAINLHEMANIGLKTDVQEVDALYVYTGQIDPVLVSETGALRWDLYSSDDGINWQLDQRNPATSYDQNNFRFNVNISTVQKLYIKLVTTAWPTTLSIPITEIEAYRNQRTGGTGASYIEQQDYTRTLIDMNLRYTPFTSTTLNYSMVWDDSQSNTSNDRTRIFQSAGVQWWYNQYFAPSFTVNDTTTSNSDIADTGQRSYSLNIQSIFLPTLDTTVGISRSENSTDRKTQTTNDSFHLNVTAILYPNLDTTFEVNTNFNTNIKLDRSSEGLSMRWTLTARLRPTLLVDFIAEHGSEGVGFNEITDLQESGGRATLNINWRPSDLVSIKANASQGYGEAWSGYQSLLLDSNFSLVRTSKPTSP